MERIQQVIKNLSELGQMPDAKGDVSDELIEKYDNLLTNIATPVTFAEAEILVQLFPEESLFGIEWTLLHILETVDMTGPEHIEKYRQIISLCPSSEWRHTLAIRLDNFLNK